MQDPIPLPFGLPLARERVAAFSVGLQDRSLSGLLEFYAAHGIGALELGVGGYPGTVHADAHALLKDPQGQKALRTACRAHGVRLAALSCHGNPLHPMAAVAAQFDADWQAALELAHALEVPVLVGFSGQPGIPGQTSLAPNWPVVAWPEEYAQLWETQWRTQVVPYWHACAKRADSLGVTMALEMHGGFAVHSPATLLQLRAVCGERIAANLDPSHLWWQGIDPLAAIPHLAGAIAHFHVKDVCFNPGQLALNGLLDHTPFSDVKQRAWHFALPGQGHEREVWQQMFAAVLRQGYQGVFSIEHEAPCPAAEGIAATAKFMLN